MIYESINTNPDTVRVNTIHLDSYTATQITDPSNTSGISKSFYNVQFQLNNVYRNVRAVKLLSLELPVAFANVRQGLNELRISAYGVQYSVFVTEGVYTNIADIISAVNTALISHASGYTFSVAAYGTEYLLLTSNIGDANQWFIVNTPFSNTILGLYSTDTHPAANTISSSAKWSLSADNYIALFINELGSNGNYGKMTFKVPLPVTQNQVLFLTENIFYAQTVYTNITSLTTLTCRFYDRFGLDISAYGYSWTASFEIISS
jgi:hypothetical protein